MRVLTAAGAARRQHRRHRLPRRHRRHWQRRRSARCLCGGSSGSGGRHRRHGGSGVGASSSGCHGRRQRRQASTSHFLRWRVVSRPHFLQAMAELALPPNVLINPSQCLLSRYLNRFASSLPNFSKRVLIFTYKHTYKHYKHYIHTGEHLYTH